MKKPCKCNKCGYECTRCTKYGYEGTIVSSNLKKHMGINTGEKSYKCDKYGLNVCDHLKRHQNTYKDMVDNWAWVLVQ